VVIVASTRVRTIAAANAKRHPDSKRARVDTLVRALRTIRAFKTAKASRMRSVSVPEVRETLKRRATLKSEQPARKERTGIWKKWERATQLACFRGFSTYLMMAVCQWYIAVAIDFFLSGQPDGFKLGYGTTSIVLASIFGSGFAVWTHYVITKPSQKRIRDHFPKGKNVIMELWDITACWAVADHLTLSCPLALSRSFDLKDYAFDADSWNTLDDFGQKRKIMEFCLVFILYSILVACVSVPVTMITRRVYASMLSDEDLAIIPFHSGDRSRLQPYNDRAAIRKPGLPISEAWASITWSDYFNVLFVYMQYFALNQFVQMAYWSANWKLHEVLDVNKYASTNLPCSPVGSLLPISARNISSVSIGNIIGRTEL